MKNKINWVSLGIALLIVIFSFIAILIIDIKWVPDSDGYTSAWKSTIIAFIAAVQTTALAVAIWEFIAKKAFAKDMLKLAKISSNVASTGIEYVYENYLDIDWNDIFSRTQSLTIAVSYATTWREHNRVRLEALGKMPDALKVFLPNYNDVAILSELSRRFGMSPDSVKTKINESSDSFKALGATVYLYNGCFQTSYYIADNEAVMAFFNHKKEKSTVPAFHVMRQGSIYKFIKDEIVSISANSERER